MRVLRKKETILLRSEIRIEDCVIRNSRYGVIGYTSIPNKTLSEKEILEVLKEVITNYRTSFNLYSSVLYTDIFKKVIY